MCSGDGCRLPARAVRARREGSDGGKPRDGAPSPTVCWGCPVGKWGPAGQEQGGCRAVRPSSRPASWHLDHAARPLGSGNVTVAAFYCFGGNIVSSLISGGIFSGCDKPACLGLPGSVFIFLEVCKSVYNTEWISVPLKLAVVLDRRKYRNKTCFMGLL